MLLGHMNRAWVECGSLVPGPGWFFFLFSLFFFFLVDWDLNQSSVPAKQPLDPHL
jgi:hypothetical protein